MKRTVHEIVVIDGSVRVRSRVPDPRPSSILEYIYEETTLSPLTSAEILERIDLHNDGLQRAVGKLWMESRV